VTRSFAIRLRAHLLLSACRSRHSPRARCQHQRRFWLAFDRMGWSNGPPPSTQTRQRRIFVRGSMAQASRITHAHNASRCPAATTRQSASAARRSGRRDWTCRRPREP